MPPKKGAKKEQAEKDDKKAGVFTEVEKTFLELQLAECNRKIGRLGQALGELEARNEQLQAERDQLDQDRADIIAYLKKQLNVKIDENQELKEKVKGLEELREIESQQANSKIGELEKDFTIMKEQLNAENKLLASKLNTLEEFRAIKDDLMQKFENQEQAFNEQEVKYKRLLYETEKKFIIGKDKLKKEMEARLLQLSQDFQDATELRIAASSHRVVRENIAINHELDKILQSQTKLIQLNEKLKENEKTARAARELAEAERNKAIHKNVVQLKLIDQLTQALNEIKQEAAISQKKNIEFEALQAKLQTLTKANEILTLQVKKLEQNINTKMTDGSKEADVSSKLAEENARLKRMLEDTATAVRAALKLDEWSEIDPSRRPEDRQLMLSRLLEVVIHYREEHHGQSMDSKVPFTKVYEEGDLGFIPKPTCKKISSTSLHESKLSFVKENEIGSSPTAFTDATDVSIKTIPDLVALVQGSSPQMSSTVDSVASFTKSHTSSESVRKSDAKPEKTDIQTQLEESKAKIQKSIMKDLAMLMQPATRSNARFSSVMRVEESVIGEKCEKRDEEEEIDIVQKESVEKVHLLEQETISDQKEDKQDQEEKKNEDEKTQSTEEQAPTVTEQPEVKDRIELKEKIDKDEGSEKQE